ILTGSISRDTGDWMYCSQGATDPESKASSGMTMLRTAKCSISFFKAG
ncbi:hypothetical protein PC122_g21478, partial [Phytophthora cactorum]